MTIRKLKEMIAYLPDDMRICADDIDESEFVCLFTTVGSPSVCVLQSKADIDVEDELSCMAEVAKEFFWGDEEFYMEALERGFIPEDFPDPEIARKQMEEHGLI